MCGIVALWKTGSPELAAKMTRRIAHRGPDEFAIGRVGDGPGILGHCRLSIIGPDNGRQPIHHGGAALVVNGEIYNHLDLRAILGADRFQTASDSEAVIQLCEAARRGRVGERWIDRLDGMFAFVLCDGEKLIAARDPLGIKPLYMASMGAGLAFASEVKAFDGVPVGEITALPPGHLFDTRSGLRRWHRMPHGASASESGLDVEDLIRELRLVLEEAVRKWSMSDVGFGAFLSGGLDSSIVAALANRALNGGLRTFAVGVKGSPDLAAARRVATHIGSQHHELQFTAADIAGAFDEVIYHLESPDVDLVRSAVPTHFAALLASRHVKVTLTGEGADELFAGYAYHKPYAAQPVALAAEITRSLGTMHNINLQRVDRITMAHGLEARPPFLDRDLIAFAQTIPVEFKLHQEPNGPIVEKWILRKACEDLLPPDIVWRTKAQFDEGSGLVDSLQEALRIATGAVGHVDREHEGAFYRSVVQRRYADADRIFATAGTWASDRVLA
ncbi:asparagine synthase B [soil metagenome]